MVGLTNERAFATFSYKSRGNLLPKFHLTFDSSLETKILSILHSRSTFFINKNSYQLSSIHKRFRICSSIEKHRECDKVSFTQTRCNTLLYEVTLKKTPIICYK